MTTPPLSILSILSIRLATLTLLLSYSINSLAVTGVDPNGVNVRAVGPTTVFLTFQGLAPNEQALESFWCGDLILPLGNQVFTTNPCDPGTILGRLPDRFDRSTVSGSGGRRNLTDIMTIPSSVSRRAFQEAQRGQSSEFFYVRRFRDNGQDLFVVVTCRMAGGGARVPFSLTDVRIGFRNPGSGVEVPPIYNVARGGELPQFGASIKYNGTGRLKGRWEVVLPGDPQPSNRDLLTEATLPVEERGLQRRYTLLERFEVFLSPIGETFIPGPRSNPPPTQAGGLHMILFRVEATDDKEGNSNTGGGAVASSGGVAGFPMPVLRYFVGSGDQLTTLSSVEDAVQLILPGDEAFLPARPVEFSWIDSGGATMYQLEVEDITNGDTVIKAYIKPGISSYTSPPWILDHSGSSLRWRIISLAQNGAALSSSDWRTFQINTE